MLSRPEGTFNPSRGDLSRIMDSLTRPILFASRNNFARINTIRDLESLVERLCSEAMSMGLPEDMNTRLRELRALFRGFDSLEVDIKKERLLVAVEMIEGIHRSKGTVEDVREMIGVMNTPVEEIKGIGKRLSLRFRKKGLSRVEDILFFLPIRYEDRRHIKRIKDLVPGRMELVCGEVMAGGEVSYGRRRVYEVVVGDRSGLLRLKWFNYRKGYLKRYTPGTKLILYGMVSTFGGQKEMVHPDVEVVEGEDLHTGGIVPVYSQIEGLHQKTLRRIIRDVVDGYVSSVPAGVPDGVLARCGLVDITTALRKVHLPEDCGDGEIERARKSIVFDELFVLELGLALRRKRIKARRGIAFGIGSGRKERDGLERRLREFLPFRLTGAQERVLEEIRKDMTSSHPMNRLIQGDVGSGKTMVSYIAILWAIEAGYQTALMAPTEILAEQHYLTTHTYSERLGIRSVLLTRSTPRGERKEILHCIRDGRIDLVIGTHALIQKDVVFRKLGLVVIDEQHRFGVVQRADLRKKGRGVPPDILVMTATPIPRTLAMTVFGDLDVSIIDELPPGRKPVHTRIIREWEREKAYRIVLEELRRGGQAYIVYPLVEESEELSLRDATNMKDYLQREVFRDFAVGLIHGKMKGSEKEEVMRDFKDGRIHVLVATTVIEVGVDVPNATIMLVEHAERFGLAQLHQLRGRVGRGNRHSTCLLVARLGRSEETYRRLSILEQTMDGFRIAEEDFRLRGPGDILGTRQSGIPDFRTSCALGDLRLLERARREAMKYLEESRDLSDHEGLMIKEVLKSRWKDRLELAEVG